MQVTRCPGDPEGSLGVTFLAKIQVGAFKEVLDAVHDVVQRDEIETILGQCDRLPFFGPGVPEGERTAVDLGKLMDARCYGRQAV